VLIGIAHVVKILPDSRRIWTPPSSALGRVLLDTALIHGQELKLGGLGDENAAAAQPT
jgi:hypothetical protein